MAREPKGLGAVDRHVVAILAEAVEAAGLSQRDVESRTRISQGRIGKILRGETPAPSIGEVSAMAEVVGMRASTAIGKAEALADAEAEQSVLDSERYLLGLARTRQADVDLAASNHGVDRELPNQDEPA